MPIGQAKFGLLGGVADLGKLELIETQTISSNVTELNFTSIKENIYNVHFLTFNNQLASADKQIAFRFFENGVKESSAVYQVAYQRGAADNNFGEAKSTGLNLITMQSGGGGTGSDRERSNGYIYIYNAGDSTKYTFATFHNSILDNGGDSAFGFGSGVLPQTSVVDGISITLYTGGAEIEAGTYTLYGIKEYS
tara:strand:- start:22 stop:603 length:582 start_codon:yes stop_codon:yes gene_type:complete